MKIRDLLRNVTSPSFTLEPRQQKTELYPGNFQSWVFYSESRFSTLITFSFS